MGAPFATERRVSSHIGHLGVLVGGLGASLAFYQHLLGFEETWRGGPSPAALSWVNLRVPGGTDYLELMLYDQLPPPDERGGKNHVCLVVPDVAQAVARLESRPARKHYARPIEVKVGVNRKRQANLFDPDGTRVELMEPATVDGQPAPPSTAPPPPPLAPVKDQVEAVIELPRGAMIKRRADGRIDFVSPVPSPYNYGSLPGTRGGDGDPIDAIVLGPRIAAGTHVRLPVVAEVDFIDEGKVDTKLVLSGRPLSARERRGLEIFFRVYALAKTALARLRGRSGLIAFRGLRPAGQK